MYSLLQPMYDELWSEIQDAQGEIYDMEAFYEQLSQLRELMDEVVELESQTNDYGVGK